MIGPAHDSCITTNPSDLELFSPTAFQSADDVLLIASEARQLCDDSKVLTSELCHRDETMVQRRPAASLYR